MTAVWWLLALQGAIGAFDTAYYHEYKARLCARMPQTRTELLLHALRDFVYGAIFVGLPRFSFHGAYAGLLLALLAFEIVVTLADFVVEVDAREPEGVAKGERVTHAVMAIVYGAMLGQLLPGVLGWWSLPSALAAPQEAPAPLLLGALTCMGVGVTLSGMRDLYAVLGLPGAAYPWQESARRFSRISGSQR
ncbi:MAG: hypothetical protein QM778_16440 [Myxococcales bacterium]